MKTLFYNVCGFITELITGSTSEGMQSMSEIYTYMDTSARVECAVNAIIVTSIIIAAFAIRKIYFKNSAKELLYLEEHYN